MDLRVAEATRLTGKTRVVWWVLALFEAWALLAFLFGGGAWSAALISAPALLLSLRYQRVLLIVATAAYTGLWIWVGSH
jgi:hypothetical protein